ALHAMTNALHKLQTSTRPHATTVLYLNPTYSFSIHFRFFFFTIPRPPKSTLFPYTTLFRSDQETELKRLPVPAHHRDHPRSPSSDRKSTRLNSSHVATSYAVFCLKKKNRQEDQLLPAVLAHLRPLRAFGASVDHTLVVPVVQ